MSQAIAFDTLAYAKKLKMAGFTEEQAEAQAEAIVSLVEERLATKQDMLDLKRDMLDLKRDIKEMESRTDLRIKELETGLRHEMKEMESRTDLRIKGLETGLRHEMKEMESRTDLRIKEMESGIIKWVVAMTGATIGILFAVIRFMPPG